MQVVAVENKLRPPIMPSAMMAAEPSEVGRAATKATASCLLGFMKVAVCAKWAPSGTARALTTLLLLASLTCSRCMFDKRNDFAVPSKKPAISKAASQGPFPHMLQVTHVQTASNDIDMRI